MMLKKNFFVLILVFLAGYLGFLFGEQKLKFDFRNWHPTVIVNKSAPTQLQGRVDFSHFWQVWEDLTTLYVDKSVIDSKRMVDTAIAGMVASLGDPYTVYLPPKQNKESKDDLGGTFQGVGIQLGFNKDKRLSVVTPITDSPAYKAGIRSGDVIVRIKDNKKNVDVDTASVTIPEAVSLIRGEKGTKVELTIDRSGQKNPLVVALMRDDILIKSVELTLEDNVALIKVNKFGDRTQYEWNTVVDEIKAKGLTAIVLDLRNNPGGYLDNAVYLASEFLPVGDVVVSQQHGNGDKIVNKVTRNGRLLKEKLVVIVNKGSASASEILAGALQDHKRSLIIGEKSFGKGSVQQPKDYEDGSGIHVTIAKWLRPSGEWIDKLGITPDVVVESIQTSIEDDAFAPKIDPQLEKAKELL
jgi:carboxyl-terminal processing protease